MVCHSKKKGGNQLATSKHAQRSSMELDPVLSINPSIHRTSKRKGGKYYELCWTEYCTKFQQRCVSRLVSLSVDVHERVLYAWIGVSGVVVALSHNPALCVSTPFQESLERAGLYHLRLCGRPLELGELLLYHMIRENSTQSGR